MLIALTLVGLDRLAVQAALPLALDALAAAGAEVKARATLGPGALDLHVEAKEPVLLRAAVAEALGNEPIDHCVQPAEGRRKRLLIADMDSTIIGCECLDELADYAGVKAEVAAITEAAMRGELEFEAALRARVARLRGLPLADLERCRRERVQLSPGAEILVRTMAAHGARCVLVSGGFDAFTGPVAKAAGFHAEQANRLLDDGERLTGAVAEPILGREAKLAALLAQCEALGIEPEQALAVGDGANDLAMIEAAGLGVAYRAKPIVSQRAAARVDHADLTALLYFQGYTAESFAQV